MALDLFDISILVGIAMMIIPLIFIVVYFATVNPHRDKFTQRNPGYDKELALFRSLGDADRAAYLEMNTGDKLNRYGNRLK